MNTKSLTLMTVLVATTTTALGSHATATGAPQTAVAPQIDRTGTVDYLDIENGRIVIGDHTFLVSPNTVIILPSGAKVSLSSLTRGTLVGFSLAPSTEGKKRGVTRIYVLPKDFVLP